MDRGIAGPVKPGDLLATHAKLDQARPRLQNKKPASDQKKHSRGNAEAAKAKFLQLRRGSKLTVEEALNQIGYGEGSYKHWRRSDPEFKAEADRIRGVKNREEKREVPDFPEFCEEYLGWRLHRHQLQWFDILEGRAPRDLHDSQLFEPGRRTHLIVNTPPNHGKSTTITVAYVLWTILKDPNSLVVIVSKKQEMAADFLSQIKDFLTNPAYDRLQLDFGPENGFENDSSEWQRTRIRFGPGAGRNESAANPTVQALGIGGQIYGTRSTLIILDDCIDTTNSQEYEKQFNWLTRMVLTRPGSEGRVLVVGTRVAPVDLYTEVRNPDNYGGTEHGWTYFAQPAVEDFGPTPEDPETWRTLWPRSNKPQVGDFTSETDDEGTYPMWTGPRLKAMRGSIGENAWIQGYQQQDLNENAIFPREDVYGSVNGLRKVGRLDAGDGLNGHEPLPMSAMYVIAGLDPASKGHTAMVVLALDPATHKRYVLNVHNQAAMTPHEVRTKMSAWTKEYEVKEWRIEEVLLSNWIEQDREIRKDMSALGATLHPHRTTGKTKWDPLAGVMSMATLFRGAKEGHNLIELPNTNHEGIRALCEQLVTFFPETKGKTDCLMALWFAEVRARELIQTFGHTTHMKTGWESDWDRMTQGVARSPEEYEQIAQWGMWG